LFHSAAFEPLSNVRLIPVDAADAVSATTLPALCAVLIDGVRGDPSFTCSDLLLGRRGLLFFGDFAIL